MPWNRLRRLRLAEALLLLLLPALLVLSLAELRVTSRDVQRAADAAYDRSLLGAMKSVDASVSTESGGLSVELPYRVFEFFELTGGGPVHYRVATADKLVELGSPDLPEPPKPLAAGVPQFYDGVYYGEPVRVVAYARDLQRPTEDARSRQLVIQIAEGTRARDAFKKAFLRRAIASNVTFLLLSLACSVVAVVFVLRPLRKLSRELAARTGSALAPLPVDDVPADVRPLVEAMNTQMVRADALASQQRMFLDDASHQLRTHLTTLRMQVDFALREHDLAQVRAALAALAGELQRASRSTNQLLSLGRSDAAAQQRVPFEIRGLLEDVARQFLPAARAKGLDLGVEADTHDAIGDPELLREALANLVSNAVAYTGEGTITLGAASDPQGWSLSVEDSGPGLPADLQASAGDRFARAPGARGAGAGLGLAIARSIAARHGGVLRLEARENASGLRATLWWPRPAATSEET